MGRLETKAVQAKRRRQNVRSKIVGTNKRPRLSVKVSNTQIIAQLVDDMASKTVVYVTSLSNKEASKLTMSEKAAWVGGEVAEKALKAKIKAVTLDRGSKKYHGRIKLLADTAREKGLEI